MIVEAPVFDGQDGLDHAFRNRGKRNVASLLAAGGNQRGDERGIELHRLEPFFLVNGEDVVDAERVGALAHHERDPQPLPAARAFSRNDEDRVLADREFAGLFGAGAVGVAQVVQPVDQLLRRDRLAASDFKGAAEDARVGPGELAMQPRVDHARELDVVEDRDRREDQEEAAEDDQRVELPAAATASGRGRAPGLRLALRGAGRRASGVIGHSDSQVTIL